MGEGALRCSLSFPQRSLKIPYVPLTTIHFVTHMHIYCFFVYDIISILGDHQEVLDGIASFEVDLDPHLATNILEAFA